MSAVYSHIAERYSVACETSDMRMTAHLARHADMVGDAGLIRKRNNMGFLLLRLHGEFDGVKERIAHAHKRVSEMMRGAEDLRRIAKQRRMSPDDDSIVAADHMDMVARVLDTQAKAYAGSELALAMMHLKSLRQVREELGNYAIVSATKRRVMLDDETILRLAGAVLEVHLTPQCQPCAGRGKIGIIYRGEMQSTCRACNGSGKRRPQIGKTQEQWQFATWLQSELEEVLTRATSRMKRHMR